MDFAWSRSIVIIHCFLLRCQIQWKIQNLSSVESIVNKVVGLKEFISIFQEWNLSELMAAKNRKLAMQNNTLTTRIKASGTTRERECDCRRHVPTTEWVNTKGTTNGTAELSTVNMTSKTFIEVINLNIIVDLRTRWKAETALKRRRHIDHNAILTDLDKRVVISFLVHAEESRARIEDALDHKTFLHALVQRSTIHNTNCISISSVKHITFV